MTPKETIKLQTSDHKRQLAIFTTSAPLGRVCTVLPLPLNLTEETHINIESDVNKCFSVCGRNGRNLNMQI